MYYTIYFEKNNVLEAVSVCCAYAFAMIFTSLFPLFSSFFTSSTSNPNRSSYVGEFLQ